MNKKKYIYILSLIAIVLVAIFFRVYQINSLPPGIHPDEAANGLDALSIINENDYRLVYASNGPREALYFYLMAPVIAIFGNGIVALRGVSMILSILSVILTMVWAKRWFSDRVALMTGVIMATLPWSIIIGRDAFRANLIPVLVPLLAIVLHKWWINRSSYLWASISGVVAAIGLYSYVSYPSIYIGLGLILTSLFIFNRQLILNYYKQILVMFIAFFVVASPMLYQYGFNTDESAARAANTSIFSPEYNDGNAATAFAKSVGKTLLSFNFRGDENNRHNVSEVPLVDGVFGLLFLFSLFYVVYARDRRAIIVLVLWAIGLLPAMLSAESIPHSLRSIGALTPTAILTAYGVDVLLKKFTNSSKDKQHNKVIAYSVLAFAILVSGLLNYRLIFVEWAQDPNTSRAYNENVTMAAEYILDNDGYRNIMVIDGYSSKVSDYLLYDKKDYEIIEGEEAVASLPLEDNLLVVTYDLELFEILKLKFPKYENAVIQSKKYGYDLFYVVKAGL